MFFITASQKLQLTMPNFVRSAVERHFLPILFIAMKLTKNDSSTVFSFYRFMHLPYWDHRLILAEQGKHTRRRNHDSEVTSAEHRCSSGVLHVAQHGRSPKHVMVFERSPSRPPTVATLTLRVLMITGWYLESKFAGS